MRASPLFVTVARFTSLAAAVLLAEACGARTPLDVGAAFDAEPFPADARAAPQRLVLFGGIDLSNRVSGETWVFDASSTWTERHPAVAPPARWGAVAASFGGGVLLFGGNGASGPLTDTWTWDGDTWTEQHPAQSPPARSSSVAVAYGGKVVLVHSDRTWIWDGVTWAASSAPSPPARTSPGLATLGGALVLFGGEDTSFEPLGDTWTWNGASWASARTAGAPSPRRDPAMASIGGTVVLFGGDVVANASRGWSSAGDTWTWDGVKWSAQEATASPSARSGAAVASLEGRVVLFGGTDFSATASAPAETWAYDGKTWVKIATIGPSARRNAAMGGW